MDTDKNYAGAPVAPAQTNDAVAPLTPAAEPVRMASSTQQLPIIPAPPAAEPPAFSIEQDMQEFIMRTQQERSSVSRTDATLAQTPVVTSRSQQSNILSSAGGTSKPGKGGSAGVPTRLYAWQGGKAGYVEISSFGFTEAET